MYCLLSCSLVSSCLLLSLLFQLVHFSGSVVSDSLRTHGLQHSLSGSPVHHKLPELAQTHVHRVGDALRSSHPLLSPSPPVFNLYKYQVFSNESVLRIRWPKYRSFSFSISPSNEYSVLISFRIDWFDLLAVQGTFKNLLQHCSLKASVAWVSAFFMVQHSNTHICT